MENSMNKAITIAVGIFITVAITSGILFSINEMRNIYSQVYETDTSITSRFSEYDAFDGTVVTGVDVINAVKKYKRKSEGGKVSFVGIAEPTPEADYTKKYKANISGEDEDIEIIFSTP